VAGSDRSLIYMDNADKFIDLLNKYRDSDAIDKKAYQNILDNKIDLADYDAKGQLKPEKILESLTDVRQIIKGIDKERRLEMLKN